MTVVSSLPLAALIVRRKISGSGFCMPKVSWPQIAAKRSASPNLPSSRTDSASSLFVQTAKRQPARGEKVKGLSEARKGKGSISEMFGIMCDEILEQLLKLIWRKNATLGIEAARDHHPGASAHKIPCMLS